MDTMREMKKAEAARIDEVNKAEQTKADQHVQLERQNVTQELKKIHEDKMNKKLTRAKKKSFQSITPGITDYWAHCSQTEYKHRRQKICNFKYMRTIC